MMDPIKDDMGIHMDYCPATAHQPDAEWNNQTIKDRVRSTFHRMPYDNLPMVLWKYLVMGCAIFSATFSVVVSHTTTCSTSVRVVCVVADRTTQ